MAKLNNRNNPNNKARRPRARAQWPPPGGDPNPNAGIGQPAEQNLQGANQDDDAHEDIPAEADAGNLAEYVEPEADVEGAMEDRPVVISDEQLAAGQAEAARTREESPPPPAPENEDQPLYRPELLGDPNVRRRYSQFRDLAEVPGRRLIYANQMRSSTRLDPILKYYMSRNRAPLAVNHTENPAKNDFHFRHGTLLLPNENRNRTLSFEPEGSINIHWSHGGFGYPQSNSDINGNLNLGPVMPMPIGGVLGGRLKETWESAANPSTTGLPHNDLATFLSDPHGDTRVHFPGRSSFGPLLPGDNQPDFNFAKEITGLAKSLEVGRLAAEGEATTLSDITWDAPNIDRQLAVVGHSRISFEQNWLPQGETTGSLTAESVQQIIENKLDDDDPRRNKAALQAYPDEIFHNLSENSKLEFEYFNFRSEAPYIVDYISAKSGLLDVNLNRAEGVMPLGTIRSEFNSWQEEYMNALNDPALPESVLPNLYIYDIAASDDAFPVYDGTSWEGGIEEGEKLQTSYDELMTMNDFESRLIPSLSEPGLRDYLEQYAKSVASSSISIDFISDLSNRTGVLAVAGSDFDIFDQANRKKSFFPIYIEFELPTSGKTEVSKLFETTYSSTSMVNAFKESRRSLVPVHFQSSGIRCNGTDENPFSIDDAPVANYTRTFLNERETKVYDFSDWMAKLSPLAAAIILTRRGNEPFDIEDMEDFEASDAVAAINSYVQQKSEELKINYKELLTLNSAHNPGDDPVTSRTSYYCENETLMYKIEKYKYFSDSSRTLLQTFYFPNSSFSNVIKYVDTQVKLGALYEYEVTAYELVYGSKFIFRNRDYMDGTAPANGVPFSPLSPIYFSFNVATEAAPKIIEYPLLSKRWRYAPSAISSGNNQLVTGNSLNGSLSYPPISVLDRPPLPPGVSILPYAKNATEVLFNFQISTGEFMGENAVRHYGLNPLEERVMEEISRKQKVRPLISPTLREGFLEFETNNQEEIRRIEIFRIKNMDVDTNNLRTIYKKFNGNLHKVLDISEFGDEEHGKAKAFDFVDKLEPNQKYYYIFRAFDASGLFSNPSMIQVVELRSDLGVFTPIIQVLNLDMPEPRVPTKRMVRYLKVSPSDLQKEPIVQESNEDGSMRETIGVITNTSDRVESNGFIVRLTSTDTGRKIDIRLNFKQKISSEDRIVEVTGNGRTQN